jgi:hypothetical protein
MKSPEWYSNPLFIWNDINRAMLNEFAMFYEIRYSIIRTSFIKIMKITSVLKMWNILNFHLNLLLNFVDKWRSLSRYNLVAD